MLFYSITSILISRFVLNLQEVHQYRAAPQLSNFSSRQDSINFARALGSLGSSLPPLGDTWLEDDLDAYVADIGGSDEPTQEQETVEALGVDQSAQVY